MTYLVVYDKYDIDAILAASILYDQYAKEGTHTFVPVSQNEELLYVVNDIDVAIFFGIYDKSLINEMKNQGIISTVYFPNKDLGKDNSIIDTMGKLISEEFLHNVNKLYDEAKYNENAFIFTSLKNELFWAVKYHLNQYFNDHSEAIDKGNLSEIINLLNNEYLGEIYFIKNAVFDE